MTHDPKAEEILARAMCRTARGSDKFWNGYGGFYISKATAILDAITPIIVAAEREAAIDAIKAKCVMHQDGSPYYIDADGDEINEIFEAIRARKP